MIWRGTAKDIKDARRKLKQHLRNLWQRSMFLMKLHWSDTPRCTSVSMLNTIRCMIEMWRCMKIELRPSQITNKRPRLGVPLVGCDDCSEAAHEKFRIIISTQKQSLVWILSKYQPSSKGGTRSPPAIPAKSKMVARGLQNGRRGLEMCLPLGFWAF